MVRPALHKDTRNVLGVYGYNRKIWKRILDREINENQLPRTFGGTRPEDDDDNS